MTSKYLFKLRFNKSDLIAWEERFRFKEGIEPILDLGPKVRSQGYFSKEDLQKILAEVENATEKYEKTN